MKEAVGMRMGCGGEEGGELEENRRRRRVEGEGEGGFD